MNMIGFETLQSASIFQNIWLIFDQSHFKSLWKGKKLFGFLARVDRQYKRSLETQTRKYRINSIY